MKTIAVFFVICFTAVLAGITDLQKAKLLEYKTECMAGTGVTDGMIRSALLGKSTDNDQLECFAACVLKKIGIMNQDGTVNVTVAREQAPADVPKEEIENVIEKCKDVSGTNDCDTAAKLVNCFLENKTFSIFG